MLGTLGPIVPPTYNDIATLAGGSGGGRGGKFCSQFKLDAQRCKRSGSYCRMASQWGTPSEPTRKVAAVLWRASQSEGRRPVRHGRAASRESPWDCRMWRFSRSHEPVPGHAVANGQPVG